MVCSQLEEYLYLLLPPYSLEILFDRRKRLLLILQRKSENIKNLMENKFNVRAVSEQLKQYDDLLELFSGVQL